MCRRHSRGRIPEQCESDNTAGRHIPESGRLENSGTIEIIGTFSEIKLPNYDGSIAGEGVINGFMVEMHSDATVYAASGQTTLKKGRC